MKMKARHRLLLTLCNRQHIPADKTVGAVPPDEVDGAPAWVTISEEGSG